jgi:quercetin dioxygenase-like cupin family protein
VFTQRTLNWRVDAASGARYWAVALQNTQLTWFEVPPGARFERHSHANEQITLVLKGELIFVLDGAEHHLGPGEVISIPGGIPHAVIGGPVGASAVDSWSPPMTSYAETTA